MEIERKRSGGRCKTSKKGGKTVKTRNAEEEAKRREALKQTLREKLELEKRALQVVERLLEESVAEDFLIDCAKLITSANYKDTIEERSIIKLCGYPVCSNKLGKIPTQQYKISTKTNKVYDITERKYFCSNFCYKASKEFELQISKTPLWLRQNESPPEITLMKKGDGGCSGEEVTLTERCLQEEDIENPPAVDLNSSKGSSQEYSSAALSDSDSSDGEQDFVSSVVSQKQVPRVHWGNLPKRTDEGGQRQCVKEEGQSIQRRERDKENEVHLHKEIQRESVMRRRTEGEENRRELLGSKREMGADAESAKRPHMGDVDQPSGPELLPGERELLEGQSVDEAIARFGLCTMTESVTETNPLLTDTTLRQGRRQAKHMTNVTSPLCTDSNPPDSRSQSNLPSPTPTPIAKGSTNFAQPSQLNLNISQVGMSKRGAAGLRDLLKQHTTTTKCDSVRQNLLEGLRKTLKQWRTEETLKFLYGTDNPSGLLPSERKEEKEEDVVEELDEDDLEEEEIEEGRGRAMARHLSFQDRPLAPAPCYMMLQKEAQYMERRVKEFFKGTWVVPEEDSPPPGHSKLTAQDQSGTDPVLPVVDSHAQQLIQKRITVEKLIRSLRDIVRPLRLNMSDISTDLNNLVRTFRFTNCNIIHRTPEWTLIAVVILHLLSDVSSVVREALQCPASEEYLDTLMQQLGLQQQDLLSLVHLIKTPGP
ncbi:putative RNA polymerase II subunit B1 CTD phosphatase rpap2 [Lampris incognitus]|uniref:putative RNA polymerase II subunit B1 CTD phosphatase rpap2 n=1 Tax=Lampris incognitus TaxID=2546036 RepID=UPI0024B49821|nr:putative RNA polymerase II subunit B1 CTD phosphatase rpap2 [Lampris incognitus]